MSRARVVLLTWLAMLAFAGNSLLCRAALKGAVIDAASFTAIRLISGAVVLALIVRFTRRDCSGHGNWPSALALSTYAIGFSFAYASLPAASGALLLFAAVQATMIGYGFWMGERLLTWQIAGLLLAVGGLVGLLLPGLSAPPLPGTLLMLAAGVAWGIYSLRGRGNGDPIRVTSGNFMRAALVSVLLSLFMHEHGLPGTAGVCYAIASGALTSGVGYAIWYTVLPALRATSAATVQLSVPAIAALGGVVFLGEAITLRLVLASVAVLGGIALVVLEKRHARAADHPLRREHVDGSAD